MTDNRAMRRAMRMKPITVKTVVTIVVNEDTGEAIEKYVEIPTGELRPRMKGAGFTRKAKKGRRGTTD